MSNLFTYASAKAERDTGMGQVAEHADETCHTWTVLAYQWIITYALAHREFISEDCTSAALAAGIPAPHDDRAWGAPFARAARQKIIIRIGYGVSKRRHLSPTPLWRSQTWKGA
jgi:hypothetical protein